jgi:hypothetical protein
MSNFGPIGVRSCHKEDTLLVRVKRRKEVSLLRASRMTKTLYLRMTRRYATHKLPVNSDSKSLCIFLYERENDAGQALPLHNYSNEKTIWISVYEFQAREGTDRFGWYRDSR